MAGGALRHGAALERHRLLHPRACTPRYSRQFAVGGGTRLGLQGQDLDSDLRGGDTTGVYEPLGCVVDLCRCGGGVVNSRPAHRTPSYELALATKRHIRHTKEKPTKSLQLLVGFL